ncbi:MAG TPA: GntR family transcriptional regulator [Ruminococcaceae bacterium]|nr:GntR family transcriptional regulator [Oscillospiraceae bacterium]
MLLKIDMSGETPIYQQIRNGIVFGIAQGALNEGDRLPTVRQLASDIGVNPMTVNKAYALLKKEGFLAIDRRYGARIDCRAAYGNAFGTDFDQRAELLISEARIKGASRENLEKHISSLIDSVYESY